MIVGCNKLCLEDVKCVSRLVEDEGNDSTDRVDMPEDEGKVYH